MTSNQREIRRKIHDLVEENLSDAETDQLWAELLGRPEDLEYLQTLGTLTRMGREGQFDNILSDEADVLELNTASDTTPESSAIVKTLRPYLVAASILIISFTILFHLLT
ncbi:MAG: hypothetical protein R3220_12600, partial [Balneolaceae bacterium]|nr:hypothetical protein [Balneolaceae bacterium]